MKLDIDFIRSQFPALKGEWTFFDNAGGSQTAKQVGDRIVDYLYSTNVQLGATYGVSQESTARVIEAQHKMAEYINAADPSEVVLGPSTTALLQNLSRSLVQLFSPGDEVIVTNCDHEANIGPWINMEKSGIKIRFWNINPDSLQLEAEELKKLMNEKTRLVAFTHASNILGTINPVKELTKVIHENGALVCVDGVAYAPHRAIDVQDLDVDFYAFSFYKVYGPHYSLLYAKKQHLEKLPGINHFFIGMNEIPYKLQPGNVNYELSYGLMGVTDYIEAAAKHHFNAVSENSHQHAVDIFKLYADHEMHLASLLLDFLNANRNVHIVGEKVADKGIRVSTISFIVDGMKSSDIPLLADRHMIGIRYGDFYARRLINDLGFSHIDGIVRVSMVHYNTIEEVKKLIEVFKVIFPG